MLVCDIVCVSRDILFSVPRSSILVTFMALVLRIPVMRFAGPISIAHNVRLQNGRMFNIYN